MTMLCNAMMIGSGSVPFLSGLQLYLDSFNTSSITKGYVDLAATGSGTSGTTVITAASTETNLVKAGMKLRIGGTDIYTVASVSTVTINTVETLSTNYVAQAMALDRISQWNDLSGKGNHYTQSTALTKPVYNPAQLNSGAVISFDGANSLVAPSALYSLSNGANTVFVVAKRDSEAATTNVLFNLGSGVDTSRIALSLNSVAGEILYRNDNGTGTAVTKTGGTNTNYQILQGSFNGSTGISAAFNNGIAATATTGTLESAVDRGAIGSRTSSSLFLIGSIACVLAFNRLLTASEIVSVNRFLAQKFNITIS